jgi:hypothetical protein
VIPPPDLIDKIEAAGYRIAKQEQVGWAHSVEVVPGPEAGWDLIESWEEMALTELGIEGVALIPVWRDLP